MSPAAYRRMDDEELARRVGRGEEPAFAALYDRYQRPLYRYCYSILGDAEDARDALQTVMLSAYREFAGRQRNLEVRAWLFRVAHNASVSIVRRRRPQAELRDDIASRETEPEAMDIRDRLGRALGDLSGLTRQGRDALGMRAFQGLGYEEIGERLSISPAAARQAVFEARTALEQNELGRSLDCNAVLEHLATGDRRRLRNRMISVHLAACEGCQSLSGTMRVTRRRLAAAPSVLLLGRTWIIDLFSRVDPAALTGVKAVAVGLAALTAGAGVWVSHDLRSTAPGSASAPRSTLPNEEPAVADVNLGSLAGTAPEVVGGPNSVARGQRGGPGGRPGSAGQTIRPLGATSPPSSGVTTIAAPSFDPSIDESPESTSAPSGSETGNAAGQAGSGTRNDPQQTDSTPAQVDPEGPGETPAPADSPDAAPGQSGNAPGHGGTPPGQGGTPPGQADDPPGQSQGAPGNSENAPGHADDPPGQSGQAPGQSGSAPGQSGSAPGQSGSAPGQSGTAPGHSGAGPENGQGGGNGGGGGNASGNSGMN